MFANVTMEIQFHLVNMAIVNAQNQMKIKISVTIILNVLFMSVIQKQCDNKKEQTK